MIKKLVQLISNRNNLSLNFESEITNRRGAKLLKLSADGNYFALKIATAADSTVSREGLMLQQLYEFSGRLYIDSGEFEGSSWLLQHWAEGVGVYKRVQQIRELKDGLVQIELLKLFVGLFGKIVDLHSLGYLHGDLQPPHFRLGRATTAIHLLDYGLTHQIGSDYVYQGALVHFSAPEICQQQLENQPIVYDQRSELYSLASVIFFLWLGQLSVDYGTEDFKGVGLVENRKRIAAGYRNYFESGQHDPFPAFEQLLEKCLAFDPNERYQTVSNAAQELNDLLRTFET